ncbi:MAG: OsmC family protein [Candidatus Hodarchaeota archaeon]
MFRFEKNELNVKITALWEKKKYGHIIKPDFFEKIQFGCPPEFGGETNRPNPEDLFLASIAACTLTSLLRICDSLRTTPTSLDVTTSTTLKFNKTINDFEFSTIKCVINVSGDEFLLKRACKLIPKYCIIGKNIIPKIMYETNIKSIDDI